MNKSGPESRRWAGGRHENSKGYVMVWQSTGKYVAEHVLVMQESLGRSLYPGENVHHKNGVRNDNRLENLELWVTTQPSGQRPEDLVEWANEILARYS